MVFALGSQPSESASSLIGVFAIPVNAGGSPALPIPDWPIGAGVVEPEHCGSSPSTLLSASSSILLLHDSGLVVEKLPDLIMTIESNTWSLVSAIASLM